MSEFSRVLNKNLVEDLLPLVVMKFYFLINKFPFPRVCRLSGFEIMYPDLTRTDAHHLINFSSYGNIPNNYALIYKINLNKVRGIKNIFFLIIKCYQCLPSLAR